MGKLRVQYPGAIYHVMSRVDGPEPIFTDEHDRNLFLETFVRLARRRIGDSFLVSEDHFHLVVEKPRANPVDGMKCFLGTYSRPKNLSRTANGAP